ncbi:MAG: hypothetical protein ACT4PP_08675 [Sporichthyaceae bacterium]
MNTRSQMACAISGLVGVTAILAGLIISGYLPPPKADWSAERLTEFYVEDRDRIRAGLLLLLLAMCGWAGLSAVVTVQLHRAGQSTMAVLQAITGAATYVVLTLFAVLLAAAAFRVERTPEDVQLLHDIGWFMAFLAAPPFCVQALATGAAILSDKTANPVYPRWLGYTGLWVALLLLPGVLLMFFLDGPFAYHGVISYWIPVFGFGAWMGLLSLCAYLAARAEVPADPLLADGAPNSVG